MCRRRTLRLMNAWQTLFYSGQQSGLWSRRDDLVRHLVRQVGKGSRCHTRCHSNIMLDCIQNLTSGSKLKTRLVLGMLCIGSVYHDIMVLSRYVRDRIKLSREFHISFDSAVELRHGRSFFPQSHSHIRLQGKQPTSQAWSLHVSLAHNSCSRSSRNTATKPLRRQAATFCKESIPRCFLSLLAQSGW